MTRFHTDQEQFWAGDFGDSYVERNKSNKLLASNINFFAKALKSADKFEKCIEFGANIGMNIQALKKLFPDLEYYAIEINKKASKVLSNIISSENIFENSILNIFYKNFSLKEVAKVIKRRFKILFNLNIDIEIEKLTNKKKFLISKDPNVKLTPTDEKIYFEIDQILMNLKKKFNK